MVKKNEIYRIVAYLGLAAFATAEWRTAGSWYWLAQVVVLPVLAALRLWNLVRNRTSETGPGA